MNFQTFTGRRLLALALTCGLFAAFTPAVQAQGGVKRIPRGITTDADYGCEDLLVVITGSSASTVAVNCASVYTTKYQPSTKSITAGQPAVILLEQVFPSGVDCTLTVTGGQNSAQLKVAQNYCALEAGTITASVTSGNATLTGSAEGSYAGNVPGIIWFNLGF